MQPGYYLRFEIVLARLFQGEYSFDIAAAGLLFEIKYFFDNGAALIGLTYYSFKIGVAKSIC